MRKIVAIANQKGGVGKTTTAINLGAGVAAADRKALLIDMDPQSNLTSGLGLDSAALEGTIYTALIEGMPLKKLVRATELSGLEVIPSSRNLTGAELELVDQPEREYRLRGLLEPLVGLYDYIIIDCPPSLGLLTVNALVAAESVLIPLQCEFFALEGMSELMSTVKKVRSAFNSMLSIEGIVFTMVDERSNLTAQVMAEVKEFFPGAVLDSSVPRNIRLAEAPSFGKPILLYDIRSRGAEAYLSLTRELLKHEAQSAR